jgi:hypothetical protein
MKNVVRTAVSALVLLLVAGTAADVADAQAQGGQGVTRLQIATFRVKPEKIEAFLALEKNEVVPALKKAGVTSRQVYRTVVGETNEFQVRTPVAGFEIYDEPSVLDRALGAKKAADLRARLNACFESVHVQFENRVNEFFVDPGNAPVQFASKYRPLPGKSFAYTQFYREYMKPVAQQAKANGTFAGMDYTVSQHGGEWGLITLNMYYNSFAPLDGEPPIAKTLGPEKTREMLAHGQGLIDPIEWIVRKRVADISF